jgi:hypothetical protein
MPRNQGETGTGCMGTTLSGALHRRAPIRISKIPATWFERGMRRHLWSTSPQARKQSVGFEFDHGVTLANPQFQLRPV